MHIVYIAVEQKSSGRVSIWYADQPKMVTFEDFYQQICKNFKYGGRDGGLSPENKT